MVPGRERRLIATGGIIGIAVILGAVLVGQDVAGWIVGLAVGLTSVVLAALLWSSRQLWPQTVSGELVAMREPACAVPGRQVRSRSPGSLLRTGARRKARAVSVRSGTAPALACGVGCGAPRGRSSS
jgi:hypothetical protein